MRRPEILILAALALVVAEGSIRAFLPIQASQPIAVLLALFMVLTALRLVLARRREPMVMWPVLLPLTAFVAITVIGIPAASSLQVGIASFRDAAFFMAVGIFVAVGLPDERAWRRLLHGLVVLALLVGAYATFRWIAGPAGAELRQASTGNSNVRIGDRVGLFGSFTTRGSLARWATHSIPLCLALAVLGRGHWRWLAALAGVLCAVAVVGTEVRIALIASVVAVTVVLALQSSVRSRPGPRLGTTLFALAGSVGVGIATFTVLAESTPGSADRFSRIFRPSEDPSFGVRQTRWPEALEIVSDNPLGLGLGVAGRGASAQQYVTLGATNTDNSYIQVALEQGIPALILLVLALVVLIVGMGRRAIRARDPEHAAAALGATASLVALLPLMYTGLSLGGPPVVLVWVLMGLALSRAPLGAAGVVQRPGGRLAGPGRPLRRVAADGHLPEQRVADQREGVAAGG
jgi:O-antigen ligase